MPLFTTIRLVNGSTGDPVLYLDHPGRDNAVLFDAGDNAALSLAELADLEAVFLTHHHIDHFIGFDRILRANLDGDKRLHVFGPADTIRRVYERIKSYELPFFAFQKLVLEVHELEPGRQRRAVLECTRRFPPPEVTAAEWSGPIIYETPEFHVEACPADHTVPCWSYALAERPGHHPDPAKLAAGSLRPGPWVGQALKLLRDGAAASTPLAIQGGRYTLGQLTEQYFAVSSGERLAYIVDTAWSDAVRPGLVRLAKGASRLYCDSFYAKAQARQAATHRHMTATDAAELARQARVGQLILIHFATRYQGRYNTLIDEAKQVFPRVRAEV